MSKSILESREGLNEVISQCAEVAGYLWEKGWAERNGGNMTYDVTEFVDEEMKAMPPLAPARQIGAVLPHLKGCWFYAKGTGRRMRDLARKPMEAGCIIRICNDCASYEMVADAPVAPTSELPSHLALQYYLKGKMATAGQTSNLANSTVDAAAATAAFSVTQRTVQCATTVVTALPILVVYPFLQKYFVTGMALGSVKG